MSLREGAVTPQRIEAAIAAKREELTVAQDVAAAANAKHKTLTALTQSYK